MANKALRGRVVATRVLAPTDQVGGFAQDPAAGLPERKEHQAQRLGDIVVRGFLQASIGDGGSFQSDGPWSFASLLCLSGALGKLAVTLPQLLA